MSVRFFNAEYRVFFLRKRMSVLVRKFRMRNRRVQKCQVQKRRKITKIRTIYTMIFQLVHYNSINERTFLPRKD